MVFACFRFSGAPVLAVNPFIAAHGSRHCARFVRFPRRQSALRGWFFAVSFAIPPLIAAVAGPLLRTLNTIPSVTAAPRGGLRSQKI